MKVGKPTCYLLLRETRDDVSIHPEVFVSVRLAALAKARIDTDDAYDIYALSPMEEG